MTVKKNPDSSRPMAVIQIGSANSLQEVTSMVKAIGIKDLNTSALQDHAYLL